MKSATDDKVDIIVIIMHFYCNEIHLTFQGDKEREKCFKILNALVKHNVKLEKFLGNEKPLHLVASAGHKELTCWLVDNGADVDGRTKTTGATPAMLAAKFGHAEIVAELLLRASDLKKQDVS